MSSGKSLAHHVKRLLNPLLAAVDFLSAPHQTNHHRSLLAQIQRPNQELAFRHGKLLTVLLFRPPRSDPPPPPAPSCRAAAGPPALPPRFWESSPTPAEENPRNTLGGLPRHESHFLPFLHAMGASFPCRGRFASESTSDGIIAACFLAAAMFNLAKFHKTRDSAFDGCQTFSELFSQ